ncbi:hypothetical protein BDN72DRAFT_918007 [Pluteus cervinus]|uniref:Uncharacterized protein n=1 Tax=Pluteus cervinus TaxID=181527 RepID=A0ACD2ZWX3_9AGAR|nr:hypothetical protein BDN72DRAFT_918007 [Pluteus cervinus]
MKALEWKRYNFLPRYKQSPVLSWESTVYPMISIPTRFPIEDWQLTIESPKTEQCGWWSAAKLLEKRTEADLQLCARVAFDTSTANSFYVQYLNYWYLRALGLAPSVLVEHYTYFIFDEEKPLSAVLVTAPPGTPLEQYPQEITPTLRTSFREKLQAIHNLGFLHNSIVPQNLFVYYGDGVLDGLNLMVPCPPGTHGTRKKGEEMDALIKVLDKHLPSPNPDDVYQGLGLGLLALEAYDPPERR